MLLEQLLLQSDAQIAAVQHDKDQEKCPGLHAGRQTLLLPANPKVM